MMELSMNLFRSFTITVFAAACLASSASAQRQPNCPAGQVQDKTGKCVAAGSVKQPTDECTRRGMVLKGGRCVRDCPAGQVQDKTGRCIAAK